jgi:hypothetical protein
MRLRRPALAAWCRFNFFEQIPRKCFPQSLRPIVGPFFGLNSWNGTSALDEEPEQLQREERAQHAVPQQQEGGLGVVKHLVAILRRQYARKAQDHPGEGEWPPGHATCARWRSRDYLGVCLLGSWIFSTNMDCKFFVALALVDLFHFV